MANAEDKYTTRLRQALVFALQEALRLQHPTARTEHILLGLLREGTGLATLALIKLGVDPDALRSAIEARLEPGQQLIRGDVEYDPEAKQSLVLAAEEAKRLGHHYIGQEHLLLALLRQQDSAVVEILADFYVTYELARVEITTMLENSFNAGSVPSNRKAGVKRYNLVLPADLFRKVELLAEGEHMTVLEVLRRCIKLGLFVAEVQETPGASLIIREGTSERQILLL